MFEALLKNEYGLHLQAAQHAALGAGSDTWFLTCSEGDFVMKFPAVSSINHPELEPELCAFLRQRGIPACDFLKNRHDTYLTENQGRVFTLQRMLPGQTPGWNTAGETLLLSFADMLGRIHAALVDYPPLPEGIGPGFFQTMTPERALEFYRHSLVLAADDEQTADEIRWRMALMQRMPAMTFDLNRLTRCNTHGDYFISQLLCEDGRLTAVIDWTTACIHPAIWELTRCYAYAAPECTGGQWNMDVFRRYVQAYARHAPLNAYDQEQLLRLYGYQIAVCDYYGQYYASTASNREIYLQQARLATRLLQKSEKELFL